jgi:hypothetical protein
MRLEVSFMAGPVHPRRMISRYPWIGWWVGPRAGLNTEVAKRKTSDPCRGSNTIQTELRIQMNTLRPTTLL